MRRSMIFVTAALCAVLLIPGAATAAPDSTHELAPGDSLTLTGDYPAGVNFCYFGRPFVGGGDCPVFAPAQCTKDPQQYCDVVLLKFTNPVPADDPDGKLKRTARFALDTGDYSDYDILAYASDENGTRGAELAHSYNSPPPLGSSSDENMTVNINTTTDAPSVWVLLEVVHWLPLDAHTTQITF